MNHLLSRLTYANVTATLALFLALGGTSYAVATIDGDDIKPGAIEESHIANGAVNSGEIANGAVGSADVDNGSVRPKDLASDAALGGKIVARRGDTISGPVFAAAQANCEEGEVAVSGGFQTPGNVKPAPVINSPFPSGDGQKPTEWRVVLLNSDPDKGGLLKVTAYAVCATPS